jgi:hypothetical protein
MFVRHGLGGEAGRIWAKAFPSPNMMKCSAVNAGIAMFFINIPPLQAPVTERQKVNHLSEKAQG